MKIKDLLHMGAPLWGALILLGVVAGFVLNFSFVKENFGKLPFFLKPTPTPFKYAKYAVPALLPTGTITYNVSRGGGSGPSIQQVKIDPLDVARGDSQKFSIKVTNEIPVEWVKVTLGTDYLMKTYEASLSAGTNTDGTWTLRMVATDTHDYVYRAKIEAADALAKFSTTIAVR